MMLPASFRQWAVVGRGWGRGGGSIAKTSVTHGVKPLRVVTKASGKDLGALAIFWFGVSLVIASGVHLEARLRCAQTLFGARVRRFVGLLRLFEAGLANR